MAWSPARVSHAIFRSLDPPAHAETSVSTCSICEARNEMFTDREKNRGAGSAKELKEIVEDVLCCVVIS